MARDASARLADPSEQSGTHHLVQVHVFGAGGSLERRPQGLGQPNRPNDGRAPLPLSWMTAAQQQRVVRELGHLPQRQQGGSSRLAGARKGVATHAAEAVEVDRPVESINRFRSALFHVWWPFER